jgi:hypothetical protein
MTAYLVSKKVIYECTKTIPFTIRSQSSLSSESCVVALLSIHRRHPALLRHCTVAVTVSGGGCNRGGTTVVVVKVC